MNWSDAIQIALTSGVVSAIVSGAIAYFSGRKLQEERRVYERIQKAYFEEGMTQIATAISEYGTSTVFAFVDLNIWVKRSRNASGRARRKTLEPNVHEIRNRKSVLDLINRDLSLAIKWFPRLQRFGMPLYGALKRTFQIYGELLADNLAVEHLLVQIDGDIAPFTSGLTAVTEILQQTEIYLEKRLNGIEDYVWKRKYSTYADFLRVTNETKYQGLLTELEEYRKELDAWAKALKSPNPDDRKRTSLSLSRWLSEHIKADPLG